MVGSDGSTAKEDPKITGGINEADIVLNDVRTRALLDTGSCVSVMSESFFKIFFY